MMGKKENKRKKFGEEDCRVDIEYQKKKKMVRGYWG